MVIDLIIKACVRYFVRSRLESKKPLQQSLLINEWNVVGYQHPKDTPQISVDFHKKYDEPDHQKKITFYPDGNYLIDLNWVIIEGTWKFSGQNQADLIDRDNGNLLKINFSFTSEMKADFLFTAGELKGYALQVSRN